ncbi:LIM/homeobox protein Lhx9 [Allomyces arbusculus]|nr:LIM/homeobox protein Lhx9 [Allomyces arbusculus]
MTTACLDSYLTESAFSSSPAPHPTLLDSTLSSLTGPFESFVPMDLSSLLAPVHTSPAVTGADVATASAPNSALSALSTSMLSEQASLDALPDFQPFLLESTSVAVGSMPTPSFSPAVMSTSLTAPAAMATLTSSPVPQPGTLLLDPSFMPSGNASTMPTAMPSPTPSPSVGFPQTWSMRSVDAPQRTPSLPIPAAHATKMTGRRMSMPMLPSSLSICSTTPPPVLPTLHEVPHAGAPISPADSTSETASSGLPTMMAPLAVPAPARRMSTSSVASASGSTEKTRSKLTREQMATLKRVYAITYFPDKATKEQLARELGLTTRVVQVWFQNQRQYHRIKMKKKALQQEQQQAQAVLVQSSPSAMQDLTSVSASPLAGITGSVTSPFILPLANSPAQTPSTGASPAVGPAPGMTPPVAHLQLNLGGTGRRNSAPPSFFGMQFGSMSPSLMMPPPPATPASPFPLEQQQCASPAIMASGNLALPSIDSFSSSFDYSGMPACPTSTTMAATLTTSTFSAPPAIPSTTLPMPVDLPLDYATFTTLLDNHTVSAAPTASSTLAVGIVDTVPMDTSFGSSFPTATSSSFVPSATNYVTLDHALGMHNTTSSPTPALAQLRLNDSPVPAHAQLPRVRSFSMHQF